MEANMERMFHNPNLRTVILQGESYLKKRRKKKKLTGFSGIVFSVYTRAIAPGQAALRFQFLFNVKEGSTDVHCHSVTSVRYVYVNLYFYNMQNTFKFIQLDASSMSERWVQYSA